MATCTHLSAARLSPPTLASLVYKEECTLCFDNQDLPQGIEVCLTCFNGGCLDNDRQHAMMHYKKTQHPIVMNIRRVQKPRRDADSPPPTKITKLAIQAENEEDKYEYITKAKCYSCGGAEIDRMQGNLPLVMDSVLAALSAKKQSEIKAWEEEITSCTHTENLEQGPKKEMESQALAHCSRCELKENMWLCLTCGNLGCGRKQYGGLNGNGHALDHFQQSNHPVAVKLGTITPEGTGDVFCYRCGEERSNPHLAKHLANFGINIATQQKTEKNLTELNLEQNLKFDFSMTTEDGKQFVPLFGPGYTGLRNLGNSCYMASVLQVVFSLPSFQERYTDPMKSHIQTCRDPPARCFFCQMAKMADGLLSGRYAFPVENNPDSMLTTPDESKPQEEQQQPLSGQDGIAPTMFKALVGKDHPDFSTMRQQDAQEFLQYLVRIVEQKERSAGSGSNASDPSKTFEFVMEERLQCVTCHRVRYKTQPDAQVNLWMPLRKKAVEKNEEEPKADGEQKDGKDKAPKDEDIYEPVTFEECLEKYFGEGTSEYQCPHCKKATTITKSVRFHTYPDNLVFVMKRFVLGDNYVMKKLNLPVKVPFKIELDHYRGTGQREGEELLPEDAEASSGPSLDQTSIDQLLAMGFPEVRVKKALIATGNNGAEVAMTWLFEHMDDPDIDVPMDTAPSPAASSGPSEAEISMLMDMGFTAPQAKRALKETGGNMERAVDWLFSHAGDMMDEDEGDSSSSSQPAAPPTDTRPARYLLHALINHKGTSTACGHYVAYIRKEYDPTAAENENGQGQGDQWVLFNDNKVAQVPGGKAIEEAAAGAYLYFYKRV
ncbi:hypothetical protein HK102_001574 [Quaeritorhiza haematococci]|nr:hypothetical protein HK102_001574 [Quaeritorhiza haematococci]